MIIHVIVTENGVKAFEAPAPAKGYMTNVRKGNHEYPVTARRYEVDLSNLTPVDEHGTVASVLDGQDPLF